MMFKDVEGYTGSACIWNCAGKTTGDYQSCRGCHVYASCTTAGNLVDNSPCPANLVWNDNESCATGHQTPVTRMLSKRAQHQY
ncbi:hypothetical protein LSAT2_032773 [Lamellibrachia satsuma]|nr:hypothetical protein LSAT2_032773 [Lamellibrachia satsuma]